MFCHKYLPSTNAAPNVQEMSPGPNVISASPRQRASSISDAMYGNRKQWCATLISLLSLAPGVEQNFWPFSQMFVILALELKFKLL